MKDFSFLTNSHPSFVEEMYTDFLENPDKIDPEWKKFFSGFDFAISNAAEFQQKENNETNKKESIKTEKFAQQNLFESNESVDLQKEFAVYTLIKAYRKRGHLLSNTNPIRKRKDRNARLELADFGLTENDLSSEFLAGKFISLGKTSLKNIIEKLKSIYVSTVGIEYKYINNEEVCKWVEKEFEAMMQENVPAKKQKRILEKLNQGVMLEKFLHTKFIGQKRFSLEGGESTIVALDGIINASGEDVVKEVVIGMAHRGRLNVLTNILHKTYNQLFSEFSGATPQNSTMGSGDVKYHLGFRSDVQTLEGKTVNIQLVPNPSHLEAVNPVVEGFSRAKADTLYNSDYDAILPILIHGDASIAGQGIVYEVLQMSNLQGYYTGGTIHFIINNQIGFTTDFDDARSADYCSSIASMVQAPVFHVNGDDPEAVLKVSELAFKFRQKFNTDVFIDMVCYRKWGHNEGDDPKFTQPELYDLIEKHENPREIYIKKLLNEKIINDAEVKQIEEAFWKDLQDRLDEVKQKPLPYNIQEPEQKWKNLKIAEAKDFLNSPNTSISEENFLKVFNGIMNFPENFTPLRKIKKLIDDKLKLFNDHKLIDWSTAELMAYGSLLIEGNDVRMSGQDVKRGTFSHRHAVLNDEITHKSYNRLNKIVEQQGVFRIYNSLLSEFAVLGFEFGYALANPDTLTIWEAQFGDFFNGAQTIIDQFITCSETKWGKNNGLVLLLPHGFEGQGPEHSSARIERFLQACAELNMIITNCTTAANFFHALRRQIIFPFRKPMVNFSPKANLRLDKASSKIEDFTTGVFQETIDDTFISKTNLVKRVLLCSGKIYFDLLEKQQAENREDVAIVRMEQLYPLPIEQLEKLKNKYGMAQWVWVQEEPYNMGAVSFLKMNLPTTFPIGYLSRQTSAATATGFSSKHKEEQEIIIETAFKL